MEGASTIDSPATETVGKVDDALNGIHPFKGLGFDIPLRLLDRMQSPGRTQVSDRVTELRAIWPLEDMDSDSKVEAGQASHPQNVNNMAQAE